MPRVDSSHSPGHPDDKHPRRDADCGHGGSTRRAAGISRVLVSAHGDEDASSYAHAATHAAQQSEQRSQRQQSRSQQQSQRRQSQPQQQKKKRFQSQPPQQRQWSSKQQSSQQRSQRGRRQQQTSGHRQGMYDTSRGYVSQGGRGAGAARPHRSMPTQGGHPENLPSQRTLRSQRGRAGVSRWRLVIGVAAVLVAAFVAVNVFLLPDGSSDAGDAAVQGAATEETAPDASDGSATEDAEGEGTDAVSAGDAEDEATDDATSDAAEDGGTSTLVSSSALGGIDASSSVPVAFSITEAGITTESLSCSALLALTGQLAGYLANGDAAGFVFVNLDTGQGIAYNIDEQIYGASSFKAFYALYVCETLIEEGDYSLDSYITAYSQTSSGGYTRSGSASVQDLICNAIVYSDNGAFGALRDAFDDAGEGFASWLAGYDVELDSSQATNSTWFPTYCASDAVKLWSAMYAYINSGTETADWLGGLLGSTETSFLRDALADYDGVEVLNKAGWCAGSSTIYDSVTDSGIVSYEGNEYLVCVMTGASYSDSAVSQYEDLVAALFECRDVLA